MTKFTTRGIKAGDEIYIATHGYWDITVRPAICTRVTPTGRVINEWGMQAGYLNTFGPDGEEIGGSKFSRKWLVSEERFLEYTADKARKAAERKVKADLEAATNLNVKEVRAALEAVRATLEDLGV